MPIEIRQLHIKSNVVQRATDGAAPGAAPAAKGAGGCCEQDDPERASREQTLAECKRMIRDALRQLRER